MIYHVNLRKSPAAAQRLCDNLAEWNIHDAIVSVNENTKFVSNIETFNAPLFSQCTGRETRAAVYIKGVQYKGILVSHLSTPDVAVVDVTSSNLNFVLISAYLPPNKDYQRALRELENALQNIDTDKKVLICSDTNSRSSFWKDHDTNDRGRMFEQFLATNEVTVLNTEGVETFKNANGSSVIDLVLANSNLLNNRPEVEVMSETLTSSDHKMLQIKIETLSQEKHSEFRPTTRRYRTNKTNGPAFSENLEKYEHIIENTNFDVTTEEEADLAIARLNEFLKEVCESSIPVLKPTGKKRVNVNDEIIKLTKTEEGLNCRYHKLKETNPFEAERVLKELAEATKKKTAAIAKHRSESMDKKFREADSREAYKIHKVFKAKTNRNCPSTIEDLEGNFTKDSHETTKKLFEHSFPDKGHPKLQEKIKTPDSRSPTWITKSEVSAIINKMTNNKAPGVDGFTPEIIKRALDKILDPLTRLYNALLKIGYFPDAWKEGFAIFIPKSNSAKKTKTVKDFRPITLLNVLAKVFEKLLTNRINKFLHSNKKMNQRQDGFSKQKSTVNSLNSFRNFILRNKAKKRSTIAIFLDISGAFDNACWQLIVESLKGKDCPTYLINLIISYFQNRTVTTNSHNSKLKKNLTQGAPQGSCCGPSLWNILLDNIFEIAGVKEKLDYESFYIRAFADDICLAFAIPDFIRCEENLKSFERMISGTLDSIYDWGKKNYLDFNVKKTQAVFFKASKHSKPPKIFMNKEEIELKKSAKYLGVWFDEDLTFLEHGLKTVDKCKRTFNIVRGYCGRTCGLDPTLTRLIYKTIIIPVLTYGSSIWYPAFADRSLSKKVRTLQYYCTKSITKSYRTASIVSTSLLSVTLPLESEAYMRAQIELARLTGEIRADILNNKLINTESYKPDYLFGSLLETFDKKGNLISIADIDDFEFGSLDNLRIEPLIRWADLPVGQGKIAIVIESNYTEAESDYFVFTDGSSRTDSGTGCSFIVKTETETIESALFPMNPFCTNFQSEMFAIYQSLDWSLKNLNVENKKLMICTDSLSSLQKLARFEDDSLLPFLINDRLLRLDRLGCNVTFVKVPAHQEERLEEVDLDASERFYIVGNIEADHLAKIASFLSHSHEELEIELSYNFISLSTVKRLIKNQMKNCWLTKAYDTSFKDDRAELNNWTKNFIPGPKFITKKLLALCDYHTSQVVIGHGGNMSYFKKVNLSKSDNCLIHKDKVDTPEHVLFECVEDYKQALRRMGISEPKDLWKVLKDENLEEFKKLCKRIITERNDLINSSSEMVNQSKNSKITKHNSNSSKRRRRRASLSNELKMNPILLSQTEFERKERNETKPVFDKQSKGHSIQSKAQPVDRNEEFDVSIKHRISSTNWLTDEHIYKFAQKEQSRHNKFTHLLMSSPIYLNDHHWVGFINSYITNESLIILVIIQVNGNHWVLGSINLDSKVIAIFDSISDTELTEAFRKLYMIAKLAFRKLGRGCNVGEFSFYSANDNPRQVNGNDCGLFVCRCIKNIFTKNPSKFIIRTGEYRKELVETLDDDDVQIRDPPSNSRWNNPISNDTCEQIIRNLERLKIPVDNMNFENLIKEFF